jgi:hypothetical protein
MSKECDEEKRGRFLLRKKVEVGMYTYPERGTQAERAGTHHLTKRKGQEGTMA